MKQLFRYILSFAATALLCTACSEDIGTKSSTEEPMPEGYGAIRLNVATAETAATRGATDKWLDGTEDERAINSYHILICEGTKIWGVISGKTDANTRDDTNNQYISEFTTLEKVIPGGTYNFTFYALANFTNDMIKQAGLTLDDGKITDEELPEDFETQVIQTANSGKVPDSGIPMTGILTQNGVKIIPRETIEIDDPIVLWRMLAKLEFEFRNESSLPVRILGVEVEPINNKNSENDEDSNNGSVYLFSKDDLSTKEDKVSVPDEAKVGPYQTDISPMRLDEAGGTTTTGNFSIYVNETDASATATTNEYSLRFKIKRAKTKNPTKDEDWYDSEIRYGFTQPSGFNVIHRNDWIKIPVVITDWRLRIEVLGFAPIGGYPSATLNYLDELNAIFSTGGWIVIKPIVEQFTTDGTVSYGLTSDIITAGDKQPITKVNLEDWLTCTSEDIFRTQPSLQSDGTIIAELSDTEGQATSTSTFTLKLNLNGYPYQFKFNVTKKGSE